MECNIVTRLCVNCIRNGFSCCHSLNKVQEQMALATGYMYEVNCCHLVQDLYKTKS